MATKREKLSVTDQIRIRLFDENGVLKYDSAHRPWYSRLARGILFLILVGPVAIYLLCKYTWSRLRGTKL